MSRTAARIVSIQVGLVLAAGLAWFTHISSGLVLVIYACETSEIPIHAIGMVALLLSLAAAGLLIRYREGAETQLVAFVGLLMVMLFFTSILISEAWVFFFDPCFL